MTYPDKKGCELILSPTIEVSLGLQDARYEEVINLLEPNQYRALGVAHLGGRVTLAIVESLTGERMWLKSVELPPGSVEWKGERKYAAPPISVDPDDPGPTRALGLEPSASRRNGAHYTAIARAARQESLLAGPRPCCATRLRRVAPCHSCTSPLFARFLPPIISSNLNNLPQRSLI